MELAGHGRQCGGDGMKVGHYVGGRGGAGATGVAGVGAGDAVAVVAFHLGERGVAQPMGGDVLRGDPGKSRTKTLPQVVVATAGQGAAVPVAQQPVVGQDRAAAAGMVSEGGGEGCADRLPANGAALLAELDQAAIDVEVGQAQREGAAAAARGLGVQAQQQCIEDDIVAAGGGGVDLVEFVGGQRAAGAGEPAGLGHPVGGAGARSDEPIGDGPVVRGAGGGDDVLAAVPAVAAVAARPRGRGAAVPQRFDVAGRDLV